jgi:hypothetical protein
MSPSLTDARVLRTQLRNAADHGDTAAVTRMIAANANVDSRAAVLCATRACVGACVRMRK